MVTFGCFCWNSQMPGRTERPSAAGAVTRKVPRGCVADSARVSRTSSISARIRVTERSSISPSSVMRIMRVFRSKSRTPREFSRVWSRLLTLPGVISSSVAAAEMLLSAATRANTRIPWTSIADPPTDIGMLCPIGPPLFFRTEPFVIVRCSDLSQSGLVLAHLRPGPSTPTPSSVS